MFNETYKDCFIAASVYCDKLGEAYDIYSKPGKCSNTRISQTNNPIVDFNNPNNNYWKDGYMIKANRYFVNSVKLFELFNIVSIDCDIDVKKLSIKSDIYNILFKLQKETICYSISKNNHMTMFLRLSDNVKNIFNHVNTPINEIGHIEMLHMANNVKLCYAINETTIKNGKDNYYELVKNILRDFDYIADDNVIKEFNKFLSTFHSNKTIDDSIEYDEPKYKGDLKSYIKELNHPKISDKSPYDALMKICGLVKGGLLGQKEFDEAIDFIEKELNPNIRSSKFFDKNNAYDRCVKGSIKTKEWKSNISDNDNNNKVKSYMSTDFKGKVSRVVFIPDSFNGGYEIIRPKNNADSKVMFGELDYSKRIKEIYDTNNLDNIIYTTNGITYFNHVANKVAGLKLRSAWLKDNTIYNNVELNENTKRCINNIFGKNAELFLKKEAIVVATLKKLKFIDIIGSRERNIGKSSIIKTFSKCKVPEHQWNLINKYVAGRPENDGKQIKFAGSVTNESVSIHIDEDGFSRLDFEFIKGLQSPYGYDIAKKGKDSSNINPPYISAYYTFNYSGDHSNIYYSKNDNSYNTTIFFTLNEDSKDINDPELNIDLEYLNSNECVYNLTKYLLKLYTSMSESEIKEISKNYSSMSKYDIDDYLEESNKSKTASIVDMYIESLFSQDLNQVNEFMESEELFNYVSRSKVSKDVIDYIKSYIENVDSNKSFTYKLHKCICCVLNISNRKYKFSDLFTGRSDRHTYMFKD